jgi:hypothetical protein
MPMVAIKFNRTGHFMLAAALLRAASGLLFI